MDPYEAYERKRRARNEAFLQRHHKVFTALIFIAALCCFILPWVWLPFWAALWVHDRGLHGPVSARPGLHLGFSQEAR